MAHGCELMRGNAATLLAVLAAFSPTSFVMANEPGLSAQEVVRRYSKTVACQIYDPQPGYQQFATVQLEPGTGNDGFGAVWLVGWNGDLAEIQDFRAVYPPGWGVRHQKKTNSPDAPYLV